MKGKKPYNFQDCIRGNQNLLHQKWLTGGGKHLFRLFYQTTRLKTFTTLTNLNYSMDAFEIKPIN